MVLEFILKEKENESVLELPPSAQGPVVVKKLDLATAEETRKVIERIARRKDGPNQPARR